MIRSIASIAFLFAQTVFAARPLVYVSVGSEIRIIDLDARKTTGTIPLTPGIRAGNVIASADGRRLYVEDGKRVAVIDVASREVSHIDFSSTIWLGGLSRDGGLLIGEDRYGNLVGIDTAAGRVLPTMFEADRDGVESFLGFAPDGSRFYSGGLFYIAATDSRSGEQLAQITNSSTATSGALAPDGRFLYAVHSWDDQGCGPLTIVDTVTNKIVWEYGLGNDACPKLVAISPDGSRAYIADAQPFIAPKLPFDPKIHVIDLGTRPFTGTFIAAIGMWARQMSFSSDGQTLIATESGPDPTAIRIIDPVKTFMVDSYSVGDVVNSFALQPMPPRMAESPLLSAATGTGALARGGLASLFGSALASGIQLAAGVPLPKSLLDTTVTLNGIPVPLTFVSADQVNLQIPWELPAGPASLQVTCNGLTSEARSVTIEEIAPGVFADETGEGVVVHAAGNRLVTAKEPARPGEVLVMYATGLGPVSEAVASGSVPASADQTATPVQVTAAEVAGEVLFAGLSPQYPGVYQVNFRLGQGTPSGAAIPLSVTVSSRRSNTVKVSVE